jgi:hypothetical protein
MGLNTVTFHFYFFILVLGTKLRALHLPDKCSSAELNPQPLWPFMIIFFYLAELYTTQLSVPSSF